MGQIRVVLIFNEDNERQKEIGEYLKSQKRCKTALITELVYAWLHKENGAVDELYSNAYIYTLPSDLEGMPLSLLEAMSYGNCCLVSDE